MYRAQFGIFVGIATIAAFIDTAGSAVETFTLRFATRHITDKALASGLSLISFFIEFFVAMVAASLVLAAIARVVMWLHEGRAVGIASGIRTALPKWDRYVLLAGAPWLLSALPVFVAGVFCFFPAGVPGVARHAPVAGFFLAVGPLFVSQKRILKEERLFACFSLLAFYL